MKKTKIEDDDLDWMEEDENLNSDFNRLKRQHLVNGFREGLSAGQNYILQSAFNKGFTLSARYFEELSKLRGSLSALLMYLKITKYCPREKCQKLEALISQLEDSEDKQCHLNMLQSEDISVKAFEDIHAVPENRSNSEDPLVEDDSGVDLVVDSMEMMSTNVSEEESTFDFSATNNSTENENNEKCCGPNSECNVKNQNDGSRCEEPRNCNNENSKEILPTIQNLESLLKSNSTQSKTNKETELEQYLHMQISSYKTTANNILSEITTACEDRNVIGKIENLF